MVTYTSIYNTLICVFFSVLLVSFCCTCLFIFWLQEWELSLSVGWLPLELLGQMKPHFVQNCLVTIRNLCRKDSKAAVEAINHFSRYLRRSMTVMDTTHPILFETEMELVENYLYMEQLRFGSDVKVEMDIRAGGFNIPALTVEPIVENAVRHGIRGEICSGTVRISTDENGEEYLITVEDNGSGFDTSLLDGGSG